jgi:hypothetical protein
VSILKIKIKIPSKIVQKKKITSIIITISSPKNRIKNNRIHKLFKFEFIHRNKLMMIYKNGKNYQKKYSI